MGLDKVLDYLTDYGLKPDAPIAFLGMGLMGRRMAKRLHDAGFNVAVWNRTAAAMPMQTEGLSVFNDLKTLQHNFRPQLIALCLADDEAVQTVIQQLVPFLQPNQLIVDFSSISPKLTRTLARQVAAYQVVWIDAPVSGGTIGAETGSLVVFAGGVEVIITQHLPTFFKPLSQKVTYMGAVGSGQVTKLCNQLIVAANSQLIAEAVHLAGQAGVNVQQLAGALAGGFADSKPLQILAPRMATGQLEPVQWKVATLTKDLNNAVQLAQSVNALVPLAQHAAQLLGRHAQQGYAASDLSSLLLALQND